MPEIISSEWLVPWVPGSPYPSGSSHRSRCTNGRFPGIAISKSVALPENLGFDYTRENASYIRVRNITLGYNLGPKELSVFKGYIRGIRVFVDFQNPLTFTKYKGYDPEINTSSSNLTGGQYPQMRVYSIGAKLTF